MCYYSEILCASIEPPGPTHVSRVPRNNFIGTRLYTSPRPLHVTQKALALSSICLQVSSHAELPATSFVLSVLRRLLLANEPTCRMKAGTELLPSLTVPSPAFRSLPGNHSHASLIHHFCYFFRIKFVSVPGHGFEWGSGFAVVVRLLSWASQWFPLADSAPWRLQDSFPAWLLPLSSLS